MTDDVRETDFVSERLVEALKAVADPTRLHLLLLCRRCDLAVSELTWIMGQSQPRISRHLKLLCEANLLDRYSEGNWVIYRLSLSTELYRLGALVEALTDTEAEPTRGYLDRLETVRAQRRAKVQAFFSANADNWAAISRLQSSERDVETAMHAVLGPGPIGQMLDLGTGTGRMLSILGSRADHALGVDENAEMLSIARQNIDHPDLRHVQVRQADIHKLPLARESVDLVTAHQVLHYLDAPDQVVREAARVLRPGGRMVIADLLPHQMESLKADQAHRRLGFGDDEIHGWFEAAGLQMGQSVKLTGARLPVGVWAAAKPVAHEGETIA